MEDEPLATIEFPHGDRIYLMSSDHRWHGDHAEYVRITNSLMDNLSKEKRANWHCSVAHELAAMGGARVIQAKKNEPRPRLPMEADG